MLHRIAERYGETEAMIRGDNQISFYELERSSAQIARGLLALGIGKGTRIGLLMPPSPKFVLFLMAAGRIGAIAVPLSTLYQAAEMRWVLDHADVEMLITVDRYLNHDYLSRLEQALPGLAAHQEGPLYLNAAPRLRTIHVFGGSYKSWALPASNIPKAGNALDDTFLGAIERSIVPADPFCIIHTSGSTAEPKGVIHGHGPFVRHSYQMSRKFYPFGLSDRVLTTRALFWVAGLMATLFYGLQAGSCLITAQDTSASAVLALIEKDSVNALAGDFGWFNILRDSPEFKAAGYDVVRINMDMAGIARRDASGKLRFIGPAMASRVPEPRHYPDTRFARTFGMTETLGGHTSAPWYELLPENRPNWQGRAVPGVTLKIVDPDTRSALPPGSTGELLVKGYCLLQGLDKIERDDTFEQDGFYATGDLCTLDDQGYLKFESRLGEMIKVHGANVAPIEVELALAELPGIEKAAVVGVPADGDNMLTAVVQMAEGCALDEADTIAMLKKRLSSFKVPKRVVAMAEDEIPFTGSGKFKKAELVNILRHRILSC